MMPQDKHTYNLMKGVLKDDDWILFGQLMYDKIDAPNNKLEEIVTIMKAHEARHPQEVDLGSMALLVLGKTWTKSKKRSSIQIRTFRKTCDSGSVSDGSI
jgi:hypothetical protein